MVKTGQTWSGLVVTKDATGALATPSVGPVGALYVDGVVNAASVAISGSNPYKWTCVLPALTAGQCVSMYITATIATIATASVVAEDVADTKRVSDLNDAAAAPSASDNATAAAAAILAAAYEGSETVEDFLRLTRAVLIGKSSGGGAVYRDAADSKARVTATLDGSGNRTAVSVDAT